jgi:hypothetical protein
MFRLTNHHQGAYCCALLKLCLLNCFFFFLYLYDQSNLDYKYMYIDNRG